MEQSNQEYGSVAFWRIANRVGQVEVTKRSLVVQCVTLVASLDKMAALQISLRRRACRLLFIARQFRETVLLRRHRHLVTIVYQCLTRQPSCSLLVR